MSKLSYPLCALFLSAGALSSAHAGGPIGSLVYSAPPPIILSAHVDVAQHQLLIAGTNFGQRPLAVTLGGRVLPVLKASATEIIASVPADLPSSNYLLRVSPADSLGRADTFSLPVQAVEGGTR